MALGEAYVSGVGMSEVGMRLTRSPLRLTRDAVQEALDEAGLTIDQIDGVASFPGKTAAYPGLSPLAVTDVVDAFGIRARWYTGGIEVSSQLGAIVAAAMAVKSGAARHVICFRTIYEAAALARPDEYPARSMTAAQGEQQWQQVYHAYSAVNWTAQVAMRHMRKFGLTREQLAQVVLTGRSNAMLNPRALVRTPLTMDEYMSARMISDPLCLFDCDRFTDASTVLIVSAGDALDEVQCTPIRIAAMSGVAERYTWDQYDWMNTYATGEELWKETDYKPEELDLAQLYDGFSFHVLIWLESLGLCSRGEAGRYVEGGKRIALDGELPINTFGGQLGAGRLHGFGFAHESVVQLRGNGGARQVQGDPRLCVATSGAGPFATALLFARD